MLFRFSGCPRKEHFLIFGLILLVFLPTVSPVLTCVWALDDYNSMAFAPWDLFKGSAWQGRPVMGVLYQLIHVSPPPEHPYVLALRLLQIAFHGIAAFLIYLGFRRCLSAVYAFLSILPFLIWSFQYEATTWFSGITYPLAACLALGGVHLCYSQQAYKLWRTLLGMLLLTLAVLTQQTIPLIGLCFFITLYGLELMVARSFKFDRARCASLLSVLGGLFVGIFLSVILMKWLDCPRLGFASSLIEKWNYWLDLQKRLWFYYPYYSIYQIVIQFMLFSALVLALLKKSIFPDGLSVSKGKPRELSLKLKEIINFPIVLSFFILLALLFVPLIGNLVVKETWATPRMLYGATLVACYTVALVFLIGGLWMRRFVAMLVILLACMHGWNSWQICRTTATVYQNDVQQVREIEAFAKRYGTNCVLIMDKVRYANRSQNPYDLPWVIDWFSNVTTWYEDWWNYRLIEHYSPTLTLYPWWLVEGERERLIPQLHQLSKGRGMELLHIQEGNYILVLP